MRDRVDTSIGRRLTKYSQAQAASILDANGQNGSTADFDYEAFLHLDGMGLDLGFMFNEADWAANGYTGGFTVPGQL